MLRKRLGIEAIERNWYNSDEKLTNYYKIPSSLIIPEGCWWIGDEAFRDCKKLEIVSFPKSVEDIGFSAFSSCTNLKKVVIPESVERIGYRAFWNCSRATIILKKPLKKFKFIGSCALLGCRDVKEETRS